MGRPEPPGHPQLYNKFESSLGFESLSGETKRQTTTSTKQTLRSAKGGQMEEGTGTQLKRESSDLNQLCEQPVRP